MIRNKPFYIAEIGANHNGCEKTIYKLIDSAKNAGADAVKFQSFNKNNIFTKKLYENQKPDFKLNNKINSQEDLINHLTISDHLFLKINKYCKKKKIIFSSTPFDKHSVNLLMKLNMPFIKIASMDLNYTSFLKYVARFKKPILLSTGMSKMVEIYNAIDSIYSINKKARIIPLYCISNYPPKNKDINIGSIKFLKKILKMDIGYSDHSKGIAAALSAIANGAVIIEKHFTLNHKMQGWDHKISADPNELKNLISLGNKISNFTYDETRKTLSFKENIPKINMRRSIVAKKNLKKGHILKFEDIEFKRPGNGISPDKYKEIIGKTLNKDLNIDDQLKHNYFEK